MTAVGSCPLLKKGKTTQTKLYSINIISPILSQFQREHLCICRNSGVFWPWELKTTGIIQNPQYLSSSREQ